MSDNILQVNNLTKLFGGLAAVSNCSLNIRSGSITGILALTVQEKQHYLI